MSSVWVKICGITQAADAEQVIREGADAIGLNFVPSSPRRVSRELAHGITGSVGPLARARGVEWVGVFADAALDELIDTAVAVGLDRVQLHGDETPEFLTELGRRGIAAYRALRIREASDVEAAHLFSGDRLLVDAKVDGALGGTGQSFDPALVLDLAKQRPIVLAGGLRPDNVERLVRFVRPFGVDTASGVESAPGRKDPALVRAFVAAARSGLIGEGTGSEIGS